MTSSDLPILNSARVSPQTRQVLQDRLSASAKQTFFSQKEADLLYVLCRAVVPQDRTGTDINFVRTIGLRLERGEGSGWRYADLPPEGEAYRKAIILLDSLLNVDDSHDNDIDAILANVQERKFDSEEFPLSLWFEGFKVEIVRYWLADPRVMKLLRYEGYADELLKPQEPGAGVAE
jgi:hypothetical protein